MSAGPNRGQVNLIIEYGIPSGPGDESEQDFRVSKSSVDVRGRSKFLTVSSSNLFI